MSGIVSLQMLLAVLTSIIIVVCNGQAGTRYFNWSRGNITLAHSANSYCDPSTYLVRPFKGDYLSNFVPIHKISDPIYDVEGYAGYDPVDRGIYIV